MTLLVERTGPLWIVQILPAIVIARGRSAMLVNSTPMLLLLLVRFVVQCRPMMAMIALASLSLALQARARL